jgi:integrase
MSEKITQTDIQAFLNNRPIIRGYLGLISGKTLTLYPKALIRFERLANTNIEELLKKTDNNEFKLRDIRTLITNSTNNLPTPTRKTIDSAVRWLFGNHIAKLPRSTIKYEENDFLRGYTKPELQQLIGYLDKPLEKLYTVIGAESGLRAKTILNLKWKHIKNDYNNRYGAIALELENSYHKGRKKSGYTFIGTRARELIKSCVEHELITTNDETPLFPYSYNSIQKIIKKAKQKADVSDNEVHVIHGLRKYFIDQIGNPTPPIDGQRQKMLKGRFNDIDAKEYSPRDFDTLRPEYEYAYPYLDYMNNMPEQAQALSSKLTELQDQNKQLNERLQLTEQKLAFIRETQPQPTGVALAEATTQWALQPDEKIFADLQRLFYNIGDLVARTRSAENIEPFTIPKMFQRTKQAQETTT